MILPTKSLILFSSFAYLASQPARVRIASSSPFVEFYESHTHTVDMFIRASEQQHQAYGYTAESECVTITANGDTKPDKIRNERIRGTTKVGGGGTTKVGKITKKVQERMLK